MWVSSIIFLLLTTVAMFGFSQDYYEQDLFADLFDPAIYDPRVPPQTFDEKGKPSTNVTLQLEIYGLQNVDTEANHMSFKMTVRQFWSDPRLTWNVSDYGGIDTIWVQSNTDPSQIWAPDTNFREDAGEGFFSNLKYTLIKVTNDGIHSWARVGEMRVVTNFNYEKFPFDQQEITMTIGSAGYNKKRLNYILHQAPLIIQDPKYWIINNNEWNFLNSTVRAFVLNNSATTKTSWEYRVAIKRDGVTMLVGLIVPGCLVAGLGSLYYLLERGSGNRISYLATVLLTEIMFLSMLTEIVPQCKNVPYIALLFLQQTCMLAGLSVVVLLLDKIQFQRDLKKKKMIKQMQQKANSLQTQRKQSVHNGLKYIFGIHSDMKHNEIDEQFEQLLEEEASINSQIKQAENGIDRCMNIADLVIWIANVSLYSFFTVRSLLIIFN